MGCDVILVKGADINSHSRVGKGTPLMDAIKFGRNKCAKMMLRKYPKLEIQNLNGVTALRYAGQQKNEEMVAILEIAEKKGIKMAVGILAWEERKNFLQIYVTAQGIGAEKKGVMVYQIKM